MPDRLFANFPNVPTEDWEDLLDDPDRYAWEAVPGVTVSSFYRENEVRIGSRSALLNRDSRFVRHLGVRQRFGRVESTPNRITEAIHKGARQIDLPESVQWQPEWSRFESFVGWHFPSLTAVQDAWSDQLKRHHGTVTLGLFEEATVSGHVDVKNLLELTRWPIWDSPFRCLDIDVSAPQWQSPAEVGRLVLAFGAIAEYLSIFSGRGEATAKVAAKLHVVVPLESRYLVGVAFLRALRLGHDRIARAFHLDNPFPILITGVVPPARRPVGREDLIRCASITASGIVGGVDSVAYRFPEFQDADPSETQRLLRNLQMVLHLEAGLSEVKDPAAGSYYIEKLTESMLQSAWSRFLALEAKGGLAKCISTRDWLDHTHEPLNAVDDLHAS